MIFLSNERTMVYAKKLPEKVRECIIIATLINIILCTEIQFLLQGKKEINNFGGLNENC